MAPRLTAMLSYPGLTCKNAENKKFPTVIWHWSLTTITTDSGNYLSELTPMSCWACFTKGVTGCTITTTILSEIEGVSEYNPQTPRMSVELQDTSDNVTSRVRTISPAEPESSIRSVEGTSVYDPETAHVATSGDVIPRARTASHAGFDEPMSKRSAFEFSPSPSLTPPPPETSLPVPSLRPGRAYELQLEALSGPTIHTPAPSDLHPPGAQLPSIPPPPATPAEEPVPAQSDSLARSDGAEVASSEAETDDDLLQLRSAIDAGSAKSIQITRQQLQSLEHTAADSAIVWDKIFSICRHLKNRAGSDRAAINAVRKERDDYSSTLRKMDTRLAVYRRRFTDMEKSLADRRSEVDSLHQQVQFERGQQEVVDQRMAQAVLERNQAISLRLKAEQALRDAYLEVKEVKESESTCKVEISLLRARVEELEAINDAPKGLASDILQPDIQQPDVPQTDVPQTEVGAAQPTDVTV